MKESKRYVHKDYEKEKERELDRHIERQSEIAKIDSETEKKKVDVGRKSQPRYICTIYKN